MLLPRHKGFTYIGVLFMVMLLGTSLTLIGSSWKISRQRENEEELLFIGNQFRQAIGLYYERSSNGLRKYPATLQDLIEDNRFPTTQRYLKRIYRDPMTLQSEWGLILAPEGGVMGVHSLSDKVPLKKSNFSVNITNWANAATVADWQFIYRPAQIQVIQPVK